MVMARHWYSSSPVVDGVPLLYEPGFWPAHLADLIEGFPPEAFGADAGDANAMLDKLHDPSAWPVFTVSAGGFTIVVHYNSGEEFTSTDYVLTHPDWSRDLALAGDDQDRIGPGLCRPSSPPSWRHRPASSVSPTLMPDSFSCSRSRATTAATPV
ncbi:hypothetical protein [Streptomyces sp. NPDC006739]|uniref:hypothetical protein n=1 Tax=Streptomyces sp. NPDC006739 TaxID=3364763 RepID=UPI0036C44096